MPNRPLIALADPKWIGHRETYFREFTLSLGRVGADVIALCPQPEVFRPGGNEQEDPEQRIHAGLLEEPARLPLLDRLPQDPFATRQRWQRVARALRKAEAEAGRKADFLFLPWLDCFLRASVHPRLALANLTTPWAGLYFRPHHLLQKAHADASPLRAAVKGDGLLRARSCRAVATLDETLSPALEETSGKPVILFPDITNEEPPDDQCAFARRIREVAKGRKVIGLIGMEPRKGVVTMLKAADEARAQGLPWLFVLAGFSCLELYSPGEKEFIEQHMARSRDGAPDANVLFPDEFVSIPDGPVFNGVMNAFDVLFIGYHDFLGSSNVLTKASILKKPVVSTELGCIGHRTKSFDLGLTIPQGDAKACCGAIQRVLAGVNWDGQPLKPRFNDYHSGHSRHSLDESMRQVIELIPGQPKRIPAGFPSLIA